MQERQLRDPFNQDNAETRFGNWEMVGEKSGPPGKHGGKQRKLIEQWKRGPLLFRGFVGDEILHSYGGIMINHYKDPF